MLLARSFEFTKTPRESFLAAYDCCLAHPRPPHTSSGTSLNFAGYGCLWGTVALGRRSVNVQLGDVFFVSFCVYPKFRPLQHLKVES